jgi:hypothetical protein
MKVRFTLLLTIYLLSFDHVFAVGLSTTNEICLAISGWRGGNTSITNEIIRFDDKLVWSVFNNNPGPVELNYSLVPDYLMKVRMFGPDGKEVSKTAVGKRFGRRFYELHSYKDVRLVPTAAEGSYEQNHGQGSGNILPAPNEFFKMKESGIYTMEIEMQMFRHTGSLT